MSEGLFSVAALLVLLVILPAVLGLVFERLRVNQPRAERRS